MYYINTIKFSKRKKNISCNSQLAISMKAEVDNLYFIFRLGASNTGKLRIFYVYVYGVLSASHLSTAFGVCLPRILVILTQVGLYVPPTPSAENRDRYPPFVGGTPGHDTESHVPPLTNSILCSFIYV
jgi:hypothetical protein